MHVCFKQLEHFQVYVGCCLEVVMLCIFVLCKHISFVYFVGYCFQALPHDRKVLCANNRRK